MTRRNARREGPRHLGLFVPVGTAGDVIADEPSDRRNPCDHCGALAWEPCTRPSHGRGRVPMRGVHPTRIKDTSGDQHEQHSDRA